MYTHTSAAASVTDHHWYLVHVWALLRPGVANQGAAPSGTKLTMHELELRVHTCTQYTCTVYC